MAKHLRESLGCLFLAASIVFSGQSGSAFKEKAKRFHKASTNDTFTAMTINNIFSYYTNNGDGSLNPFTGDGGCEIISANRGLTMFEEGLIWGGRCMKDGVLKVGGSYYNHGLQAGRIITAGTTTAIPVADDPLLAKNRIYKVRPDVGPNSPLDTSMLNNEVGLLGKYETKEAQQLYNQYVEDWNEWPAVEGAPYDDKDNNGVYDPAVDIPGIPGAHQTIWYVANDLDSARTYSMAGSNPIGLEFQRTIWAYDLSGPLDNTIFQKNILINKSGYAVDSMYVAQWADPDLGGGLGYTDDFVGCDTLLNIGYVYNGDNSDGFFGDRPPAVGFDFFQGPLVQGGVNDSGKYKGHYIKGKKNLGMTAFNFFIGSNATYSDPALNDLDGTREWYNLMRGLVGRTGAPYVNPTTNTVTPYVLSGDPVTKTGWIDGIIAPPGDRRLAMCSGPFAMANGDTQEIVVAYLAAQGGDRFSSVKMLKIADQSAQFAYDNNFEVPYAPANPAVMVNELDKKIILNWFDRSDVREAEVHGGYAFQGYNVYQLPGNSFTDARRIATFDKVDGVTKIYDDVYDGDLEEMINRPVQFGNDEGIKRYFIVDKNYLGSDPNAYDPLVNGKSYYFAVTAYNYNPDPKAVPHSFESEPVVFTAIPQSAKPGTLFSYNTGDSLPVTHTGSSEGLVAAQVMDPALLTGHQYEISFDTAAGMTTWSLTDITANNVLIANQTQTTPGTVPDEYIFDGVKIAVFGPASGMKNWSVMGTRQWTWVGGNRGLEGFNGAIGNAYDNWYSSSTVTYDKLKNVEIRFAGTDTSGNVLDPNDPDASFGYRYLGNATAAPAQPSFTPFIVNASAGYAFQDYTKSMPLAAYDMEVNPPRRLMVGYIENNQINGLVDGKYWPPYNANGTYGDNIAATGPREWLFIFDADYNETPDQELQTDILNNRLPIMWFCTVTRRDQNGYAPNWTFRIDANHVNGLNDRFSFTATASSYSDDKAKADVAKINVYPNPYFGANYGESSSLTQHVTFNHLPRKATISIITLGGVRVRKFVKDDDSQFLRWDLLNEYGFLVASGMYVVYIDMGALGTKILKLAVVQQTPIPTNW